MREATRVLARGGQPSVAEIAKAAGVSRTTFYRAFASRAGLLQALELEPEPGARQRVLEVALRLLRTQTLADLSMDELASEAGISRANLYRLFPGKAALFRAILIAYSPFEPVMAFFDRMGDRPEACGGRRGPRFHVPGRPNRGKRARACKFRLVSARHRMRRALG